MVKFRSLYNDPNNKMVREVIDGATGPITIFEPSREDIESIMRLNDIVAAFNEDDTNEEGTELDIDGTTIIRELIPMLTDIEMEEDLDDEEIADIIENPTVDLMNVSEVLSGIVTQVFTLMAIKTKNQLDLEQLVTRTQETRDSSVNNYISESLKTDEGRQQLRQLNELAKQAKEKVEEQEDEDEQVEEEEEVTESNASDEGPNLESMDPEAYQEKLAKELKDRFGDL